MPWRAVAHTVDRMTTSQNLPTLRENVDELVERLARIGAAAAILRNLAPDIRPGIAPSTLVKLSEDLQRDLMLASRELSTVRERALVELHHP
jgi:hypothetical protein